MIILLILFLLILSYYLVKSQTQTTFLNNKKHWQKDGINSKNDLINILKNGKF